MFVNIRLRSTENVTRTSKNDKCSIDYVEYNEASKQNNIDKSKQSMWDNTETIRQKNVYLLEIILSSYTKKQNSCTLEIILLIIYVYNNFNIILDYHFYFFK